MEMHWKNSTYKGFTAWHWDKPTSEGGCMTKAYDFYIVRSHEGYHIYEIKSVMGGSTDTLIGSVNTLRDAQEHVKAIVYRREGITILNWKDTTHKGRAAKKAYKVIEENCGCTEDYNFRVVDEGTEYTLYRLYYDDGELSDVVKGTYDTFAEADAEAVRIYKEGLKYAK